VQFYLAVINTYKAVNLAWQCNFGILGARPKMASFLSAVFQVSNFKMAALFVCIDLHT